jgi:predicted acylesterase/phospholipase RssA
VNELDRQLFRGAKLSELPPWILVNATNLRTGRAWKFYRDRAGDYLAGATERTEHILAAEAVAASAAYPGLADAYAFKTRWEHLRGDILAEEYWERPQQHRPGTVSRWRERYGQEKGAVTFPLVDGGLYDNEGINGLRGRRVTHAIVSAVAPPESDAPSTYGLYGLLRVIDVVHDRLGAATRQLAHEMTHGVRPDDVTRQARALAGELRALAGADSVNDAIRADVEGLANRAEALAAVGYPPRGHQFTASAQILLHRLDLARDSFAGRPEGIHVPTEYRGVDEALVAELSRVRTDVDALEPEIVTLLMAQGYYLTDFYVKLTMPEIVFGTEGSAWYEEGVAPTWSVAQAAVTVANSNQASTASRLRASARRAGVIGRTPAPREARRYAASLLLVGIAAIGVLLTALAVCAWGVCALLRLALSRIG